MANFADRSRSLPREFGLLFFLFAVFLLSGVLSLGFSERARWVPVGTATPGACLCLWEMVRSFRRQDGPPVEAEPTAPHGLRNMFLTLAAGLGLAVVWGFLYSVPVIFFLFALLTEGRPRLWSAGAIAILATLVVYLLFGVALQIPLTQDF